MTKFCVGRRVACCLLWIKSKFVLPFSLKISRPSSMAMFAQTCTVALKVWDKFRAPTQEVNDLLYACRIILNIQSVYKNLLNSMSLKICVHRLNWDYLYGIRLRFLFVGSSNADETILRHTCQTIFFIKGILYICV